MPYIAFNFGCFEPPHHSLNFSMFACAQRLAPQENFIRFILHLEYILRSPILSDNCRRHTWSYWPLYHCECRMARTQPISLSISRWQSHVFENEKRFYQFSYKLHSFQAIDVYLVIFLCCRENYTRVISGFVFIGNFCSARGQAGMFTTLCSWSITCLISHTYCHAPGCGSG